MGIHPKKKQCKFKWSFTKSSIQTIANQILIGIHIKKKCKFEWFFTKFSIQTNRHLNSNEKSQKNIINSNGGSLTSTQTNKYSKSNGFQQKQFKFKWASTKIFSLNKRILKFKRELTKSNANSNGFQLNVPFEQICTPIQIGMLQIKTRIHKMEKVQTQISFC